MILSGCGFKDGTEITEAVSALIALTEMGAEVSAFAPDVFAPSVDHATGASLQPRNVFQEAARITRGHIGEISAIRPDQFDGLIFPGGFGAANILSDWAVHGGKGRVRPDVEAVIHEFHHQEKPLLGICIAPVLFACALRGKRITLTTGALDAVAEELLSMGVDFEPCEVTDFVTDRDHKIITTPAYMYDAASPFSVFAGIRSACRELVNMA